MTRYYPYHLSPYGRTYTPESPNTYGRSGATRAYFLTRDEAVSWLRTDFLGCVVQREFGAAYIAEINDESYDKTLPVKVKRIKFVKKVKPTPRYYPTWVSTWENPYNPAGVVTEDKDAIFATKAAALKYAEGGVCRGWRVGTPKEVK